MSSSIDKQTASRTVLIQTLDLAKPPDAIAFSPVHPEYFVTGTYNLKQDDGTKDGSLVVFKIVDERMDHIQTVDLDGGVYDISFDPYCGRTLAVTLSSGYIEFYDFEIDWPTNLAQEPLLFRFRHLIRHSTTVTCLAWDPAGRQVAVACQGGDVFTRAISASLSAPAEATMDQLHLKKPSVVTPQVENEYTKEIDTEIQLVHHHEDNAWIVVYTPTHWPVSGLFSGGDDNRLYLSTVPSLGKTDSPSEAEYNASSRKMLADKHIHSAGVTAILPLVNNVLMTGSYDEQIRIIELQRRNENTAGAKMIAQVLCQLKIDGGCWRMEIIQSSDAHKDSPDFRAQVLVNSHDAGPHIVQVSQSGETGDWSVEILDQFKGHGRDRNTYACSVMREQSLHGSRLFVSGSMADNQLCLWRWKAFSEQA